MMSLKVTDEASRCPLDTFLHWTIKIWGMGQLHFVQ